MSFRVPSYLPVVLPPLKDPSDPPSYYADIEFMGTQVTADTMGNDRGLEITISNSNNLHPSNQFDHPLPLSTVFAPTSGFARFYPSSAVLPTPDQQPVDPPADLITTDIGSVMIRVWISDYADSRKSSEKGAPCANRIVLSWLQRSVVETVFKDEITKLKTIVLEKSWKDGGGTGPVPDRAALEAAFLQRFMKGDAEIFVSAGAALGAAALVKSAVPALSDVAQLKLQAFFEPADPNLAVFVAADEVIDNAAREAGGDTLPLFEGHPLVEATDGEIGIHFRSKFMIWDNQTHEYIPFAKQTVMLMKAEAGEVARDETDDDGIIDLAVQKTELKKSDNIYFQYATFQTTYGDRSFTEDIITSSHKARRHLSHNGENTKTYRAKYEIYPKFRDFIDGLADNEDDEVFELDRGNGSRNDKSTTNTSFPKSVAELLETADIALAYAVTTSSQKEFLQQIAESEKVYKNETLPKMFTLLVEGDSWFHYPLARNDIYGHVDGMIGAALREKNKSLSKEERIVYLRFPLQHFGDRSDQMFGGDSDDDTRQWHFTKEFPRENKIDLILCSGGGNDFAEPGISNRLPTNESPLAAPYKECFGSEGYFDPFLADSLLDADELKVAKELMGKSFAILLNNHPWNIYAGGQSMAEQQEEFSLYVDLDQKLIALSANPSSPIDFGESDPDKQGNVSALQDIGTKIIKNFPVRSTLPVPNGDKYDQLLAMVFDCDRYKARFDQVLNNWRTMLNLAKAHGIPVSTHTYCYPLFNEKPTSILGYGRPSGQITGPWFGPRFGEARIRDRRVRFICLKVILDNYVEYVLKKLKSEYGDLFSYADVRDANPDVDLWRDEMHLRAEGFKNVATKVYGNIAKRFPEILPRLKAE